MLGGVVAQRVMRRPGELAAEATARAPRDSRAPGARAGILGLGFRPYSPSCLVGGRFPCDHFLFLGLYLGQTVAGFGVLGLLTVVGDDSFHAVEGVSPVREPGQVVLDRG